MPTRSERRLPGVRFEVVPSRLPQAQPRMDVCAFVGIAASGPIDVPVAVEDIGHFEDLYGDDAPIAWDAARGAVVNADLAAAVRAFFRQGGVRCVVVRVAGRSTARANEFAIPGLVRVSTRGGAVATTVKAVARSEGSWSDPLQVSAALGSAPLEVLGSDLESGSLTVRSVAPAGVAAGDLLRVTFLASPWLLYLPVASATPLGLRSALRLHSDHLIWASLAGTPASPPSLGGPGPSPPPGDLDLCEKLTFELWWRRGASDPAHLGGLGFCPGHPRYWAALPTDVDLYLDAGEPPDPLRPALEGLETYADLRAEASSPRVPLAGQGGANAIFVPLKMSPLPASWAVDLAQRRTLALRQLEMDPLPLTWSTSGADADSSLERDGLKGFSSELFLDPDLIDSDVDALAAQADFLRYQSVNPRRLLGIHALLARDEVTLLAVPDAAQRPWSSAPDVAPLPPEAPDPEPPDPTDLCGGHADRLFADCDVHPPGTPLLTAPRSSDRSGSFALSWSAVAGAGVEYELQESLDFDYADAVTLRRSPALATDILGRTPGNYYYRVRAVAGRLAGAWSIGRVVIVKPPVSVQRDDAKDFSPATLLAVQRATLRMCAARGDLLALLALPQHYREADAVEHSSMLRSSLEPSTENVAALGFGEARALSHGALYHPWLIGREENRPDVLRAVPPDGAAAGIVARRTLARGAWVAPANELLAGVVALAPAVGRDHLADLHDAQVNVFRQEPRGFLALAADTLSADDDLLPINVRRLLSLLRRAALTVGAEHVFEPNDATLRRHVERSFESLLGRLYRRGAFAGRSPDSAFQVVATTSVNPPQSLELGRFIVELRVAPSMPLDFLTVRLVQSGDRGQVTEER